MTTHTHRARENNVFAKLPLLLSALKILFLALARVGATRRGDFQSVTYSVSKFKQFHSAIIHLALVHDALPLPVCRIVDSNNELRAFFISRKRKKSELNRFQLLYIYFFCSDSHPFRQKPENK